MAARYVENIGRRIKDRRTELEMSQGDIARALPGKVDANQVSRWERGLHKPSDQTLEDLAAVLQVESGAYFLSDGPTRAVPATTDRINGDQQLDRIEAMLAEVLERLDQHGLTLLTPGEVAAQALRRGGKKPGGASAGRRGTRRSAKED